MSSPATTAGATSSAASSAAPCDSAGCSASRTPSSSASPRPSSTTWRHVYPDLAASREFILRVLALEEERFQQVFDNGNRTLAGMIGYRESRSNAHADEYERQGREIAASSAPESADESWTTTLSGQEAFFLHDTYGFPVEITQEIAAEHGLAVDMDGFRREMEAQRERSRAGGDRFAGGPQARIFQYQDLGVAATRFLGYDQLAVTSVVVGMLSPEGEAVASADAGQEVEIVLRETPFYAEGGGQVGDAGIHRRAPVAAST